MTRVDFGFDAATVVPLPGADLGSGDVEAWAAGAAARMAGLHDLPPQETEVLARALARAQRSAASDPGTNLLTFEPATWSWAPLRLTLADWEPDAEEQRRYLWPPSVLAPRIRPARSTGLGEGCSVTLMDEDGRGVVRWLFMTTGASFFAVLGPLDPAAIALSAARVEDLLDTVRIDGAPWTPSGLLDVPALVQSAQDPEGLWRV
jgi:hypothetical protein